jgi:dethiobiotin synthetase
MRASSHKGFFITGTDTGVGKTWVGTALARILHRRGADVQPRKPAESGCRRDGTELIPADGTAYHTAVAGTVPLTLISAYRYAAEASTERAARLAGTPLKLKQLLAAATAGLRPGSILLVEGAGGFYSPLCSDALNADLAASLGLPVILVAADRLGCLNHILLTLAAIEQRGLRTAAVLLNSFESVSAELDNAGDLRRLIPNIPVLNLEGRDNPELEAFLEPLITEPL